MHRRVLVSLAAAGLMLCMVHTSLAQYPKDPDPLGSNPPVLQDIGMVDTSMAFATATEATCRLCHDGVMTNEHHVLYGKPIDGISRVPYPDTDGDGAKDANYSCLSCHGTTFTVVRDCKVCHMPTGVTSPHHQGEDAVNRHCTECHGDLIADYDDGHYIPTYDPSFVTPKTSRTNVGWNDPLHTDPWRESDGGSGIVKDTDVLDSLDTGIVFAFGDTLTRNDPAELRFKPDGIENDFMIDEPNRGTNQYNVVFIQGGALAASWNAAAFTLTVTLAPEQTAQALVAAINAAVPASGRRVRATKLTTDGSGGLLPEIDYSPLGGMPLNNRDFSAGACNYCHDDDGALDINGDPKPVLIINNHDTHHNANMPDQVSNGAGGTWRRCNVCHDYTTPPRGGSYDDVGGPDYERHIRICQECHSTATLHNIQADSNGDGSIVVGRELAGYGHVGRDGAAGDSDCWGCHGFSASSAAPFTGPLVPTIHGSSVDSVTAGKATSVLLSGAAFTNTSGGQTYTSNVVLTSSTGAKITLTPDVITDEGQLAVTIPATTPAGSYRVRAVKGEMESNPATLTVIPKVTIGTVNVSGLTTTINGTGFGGFAQGSGTKVSAVVANPRTGQLMTMEGVIKSWNDAQIVVNFRYSPKTLTVESVFGTAVRRISR